MSSFFQSYMKNMRGAICKLGKLTRKCSNVNIFMCLGHVLRNGVHWLPYKWCFIIDAVTTVVFIQTIQGSSVRLKQLSTLSFRVTQSWSVAAK